AGVFAHKRACAERFGQGRSECRILLRLHDEPAGVGGGREFAKDRGEIDDPLAWNREHTRADGTGERPAFGTSAGRHVRTHALEMNVTDARAMTTGNGQRIDAGKREMSGIERSEEHTSELQSRENLVCRLLLEKKKKKEEINIKFNTT